MPRKGKILDIAKQTFGVGLAVHSDCLRYVRIRKDGRHLRVDRAECLPVRDGPEALKNAVLELRERIGGFSCPVALGIPSTGVKLELLRYPIMPVEEVRESLVLDFELISSYPFEDSVLSVVRTDFAGDEADNLKPMSVLAAVSLRKPIDEILAVAELAGMSVCSAEPFSTAYLRASDFRDALNGVYLSAWFDSSELDITLVYRGSGIFYRSVPLPGSGDKTGRIARHIIETEAFAKSRYRNHNIRDLMLSGRTNDFPQLKELLETQTALNIHIRSAESSEPYVTSDFDLYGFEAAAGLALRSMNNTVYIDLRPPEYAAREKRRRSFNPLRTAAAALLSAFIAANAWHISVSLLKVRSLSGVIEAKMAENDGIRSNRDALLAETDALKKEERELTGVIEFLENEMPALETLNAMEMYAVPGTEIGKIYFNPISNNENIRVYIVSIEAVSDTEDGVIALAEGLAKSGAADSVTVPESRKDEKSGKVSFLINMITKPFNEIRNIPPKTEAAG